MAEALLEIVDNLGSLVQDQLATYWDVDEQTQKLSSNLKAIRAVLRDAERKQITSPLVKDWLQKLTDAAYVLDDICSIQSRKCTLMDLRHIVINGCPAIVKMPPKISKLRHLRTLSLFVVGSKSGCGLTELHSLKLGGTLRIKGLDNVPNEWDAKQANLIGKKDLNILHLSWDGNVNSGDSKEYWKPCNLPQL
ncbi:hypothetical protein DEO72_LG4g1848 [Vigna unguiculata]|uniref:Uncharacterized protein n=1 Tax=Vigna unguiculata TaxID=3917 RepID=A0A4D6LQK9_VIGUN|nr:hypothetical protein DEO72_LG4g1848 [Vigna unguiculata]